MIAKTPKTRKTSKTRYADHIKEWEDLSSSLVPSATEAPQIEIQRAALQKMLEQARDLTTQQSLFQAQKPEVSNQLGTLMTEGKRLATVLRATVKQHYGIRNEKLAQFGIGPFQSDNGLLQAWTDPFNSATAHYKFAIPHCSLAKVRCKTGRPIVALQ